VLPQLSGNECAAVIPGQNSPEISLSAPLADALFQSQGQIPFESPSITTMLTEIQSFEEDHYNSLREVLESRSVPSFVRDGVFQFMRNHKASHQISKFKCSVYDSLTELSQRWVLLEWTEGDLEILCLAEVEIDGFCNFLTHSGLGKQSSEEGKRWTWSAVGWTVSDFSVLQSLFLAAQYVAIAQQSGCKRIFAGSIAAGADPVERYLLRLTSC